MKKMTDGIYVLSVPLPFAPHEVNCYLLEGEKGFTVVDTGFYTKEAVHLWESALSGGIPVEKVVLTHFHPDHSGLVRWFKRQFDVPVVMSRRGYSELQNIHRKIHRLKERTDQPYLFFLMHGGPVLSEQATIDMFKQIYFEPDILLEDGQEVKLGNHVFESIATPGHSPDHLCFYNRSDGIMLIGDHVLNPITPIVSSWDEEAGNPLLDYFTSLDLIASYPVNLVLPGHGVPLGNLQGRVEEIKEHHRQRLRQMTNAIEENGSSADHVCRHVFGHTLHLPQYAFALAETIAHLTYLESVGNVEIEVNDGKIIFHRRLSLVY
jgi:glyoxylase-like metal-dependent hydrolase (beta-lactamase superfamily II)